MRKGGEKRPTKMGARGVLSGDGSLRVDPLGSDKETPRPWERGTNTGREKVESKDSERSSNHSRNPQGWSGGIPIR